MAGVFLSPTGDGWQVLVVNGNARATQFQRKLDARHFAFTTAKAQGLPVYEELVA